MNKLKQRIKSLVISFFEFCLQIFPDMEWGNKLRGNFYKRFLKQCGKNLQISKCVRILHPEELEIGSDVYIGYGSWINSRCGVIIGDEVMLGPYVCIISSNHTSINGSYRFGQSVGEKIVINKGAWLGAHSLILSGTMIGSGVLVAAGGVVTKDVQSNSIVGGIPAKQIKVNSENMKK